MGIVEVPEPVIPVVPAGPSMKRIATFEDVKPDEKAMLIARVKELEVSRRAVVRLRVLMG